jgi:hypothetical protein
MPTMTTATSSLTCSPTTPPIPKRSRLALGSMPASRSRSPPRSCGRRRRVRRCSPNPRGHTTGTLTELGRSRRHNVEEANGVVQRLYRMAHPGVARDHRLRSGLHDLVPAAQRTRPSRTLNEIGPDAECSSSRSPALMTSNTMLSPPPFLKVMALRLPCRHSFSLRRRATSASTSRSSAAARVGDARTLDEFPSTSCPPLSRTTTYYYKFSNLLDLSTNPVNFSLGTRGIDPRRLRSYAL